MRIWDLEPASLCDRHLLGEHRELHAIWSILTTGKRAYRNHPETVRWHGRLAALYARHEAQVAEMSRRGFRHASPLDRRLATGAATQTEHVDSIEAQRQRLAKHGCACRTSTTDPGGAVVLHYLTTPDATKEKRMRAVLMSKPTAYSKDMTRSAHVEPGDPGARRRR